MQFDNIRILYNKNNEPWFVGIDIARVLHYKNPSESLNKLISLDYKIMYCDFITNNCIYNTTKKIMYNATLINYNGLKQLACKFRLPNAENFCKQLKIDILNNK